MQTQLFELNEKFSEIIKWTQLYLIPLSHINVLFLALQSCSARVYCIFWGRFSIPCCWKLKNKYILIKGLDSLNKIFRIFKMVKTLHLLMVRYLHCSHNTCIVIFVRYPILCSVNLYSFWLDCDSFWLLLSWDPDFVVAIYSSFHSFTILDFSHHLLLRKAHSHFPISLLLPKWCSYVIAPQMKFMPI